MTALSEDVSVAAAIAEDLLATMPGLTDDFALRVLNEVGRDSLKRVACWQLDFVLSSRTGLADYKLDPRITGARIHDVRSVAWDGQPLAVYRPEAHASEAPGIPRYWWQATPGVLRLHPAPDATRIGVILVRGVLAPIDSLDPVPEEVLVPLREMLTDGAKAKLYVLTGKPWSSGLMAGHYQRLYRSKQNRLRHQYASASAPNARPWAFPGGWA